MVNPALLSSANDTWNTPQSVLDALKPLGAIALDPCSNPTSIVGAKTQLSLEDGEDGLSTEWSRYSRNGLIFVNPPYPVTKQWSSKIVGESLFGCEIIALVPARTDTKWWQIMFTVVDVVAFWRGRISFGDSTSSAPFPSALLYYGTRTEEFCSALREHASLMVPARQIPGKGNALVDEMLRAGTKGLAGRKPLTRRINVK